MALTKATFPCLVHFYHSLLTAYEIPSPGSTSAIIFIGGLTDGPHTVPYIHSIAAHLSQTLPDWSIFEIRLTSSFSGFGHNSLDRDIQEISKLVTYLRMIGKHDIVLFGHSTGSQDCIHYAVSGNENAQTSNPVDGFIMQGPVSDREMFANDMSGEELSHLLKVSEELIEQGKPQEPIPRLTGSLSWFPPISAYRFHSLAAKGGDDDYFSTDLSQRKLEEIFGKLSKPTLMLHSSNDEAVAKTVDKTALIKKWQGMAKEGVISDLSGEIPGANHRVEDGEAQRWLAERVERFLRENYH